MSFFKLIVQEIGNTKADSLKNETEKVIAKLLQSVTEVYYKVRQVLQTASGITKCNRLLLQSASGITKCDRLSLQSA